MSRYRENLPQLSGRPFLTDAGIETDLIFNHGIEIREFATHTLLADQAGRQAILNYFRGFLGLARLYGTGFILDTQTWKAHPHWAKDLGATDRELEKANRESVELVASLREEFSQNAGPIVLNAIVGPRGDGYAPETRVAGDEAHRYHSKQLSWLAETEVDMVTATTFNQSSEAIGFVRAAAEVGLPAVISFTVEIDGNLPTGQPLGEAISTVDDETDGAAAYFMVNCAHPDHFFPVLNGAEWTRRLRGMRCNASRLSHAELDACTTLDAGNPVELGEKYRQIAERMPWLNVFGGCCGSDLRHVKEIARAVLGSP